MSDSFDSKKFGSIVAIPFAATNVTTGAANQDLVLASGQASGYVAPRAGSIVGISAACGAITAGGIAVKAHKASTELTEAAAPTVTLNATNDTNGTYANVRPGALRFAAGDTIGVSLSATTTALDPTNTLDVDAFLHIQLDP